MGIDEQINEVLRLEKEYLKYKYISPNENSLNSKRTFSEWHSAASVLFSEFLPEGDMYLRKFVDADTSGNAFGLSSTYDSIHTSYKILLENVRKVQHQSRIERRDDYSENPAVFISHSSKDKDIIKLFIDHILKNGLGLKDEEIACTSFEATGVGPGDNIPNYIKRNIKESKICLSMVSANYKSSEVCMNEVGAAWALNNPPIQVVLPDADFNELGWLINTNKASRINNHECLDALEEKLCHSIGISIPTPKHWNPCVREFLSALNLLLKKNEA